MLAISIRRRRRRWLASPATAEDLVLTSDHEWCTYAELSGIGIHQLITDTDGDEAVTIARFTWDGYDLLPDDQGSPPSR